MMVCDICKGSLQYKDHMQIKANVIGTERFGEDAFQNTEWDLCEECWHSAEACIQDLKADAYNSGKL